ncbi:hypothetical protein HK102_001802 [Quaeritorhiza haematococci]|nr:hypothetical protein HK102_001802 [Quaeritorhiza haematococci]
MKSFKNFAALILALTVALAAHVSAHASVNPSVGIPGAYSAHTIRIGHGCGKSPTNNVTVQIPDGISSVKPRQLTGWTITITKRPLATPIQAEDRVINETVDTVSWHGGNLADDYFEDFGLSLRLPTGDDGTKLWFKVWQDCVNGTNPWITIPEAGKASPDYPAAALTLMKNGTLVKDNHGSESSATAAAATSAKSAAVGLGDHTMGLVSLVGVAVMAVALF